MAELETGGDILDADAQGSDAHAVRASWDRSQPRRKEHISKIVPNMTGVRTDEQLDQLLQRNRDQTVVVNFGASWCTHCHQLLPTYVELSKQFPGLKYALAQVDYMDEAVKGMTYTPTFAVFKKGRKVDQFYGANEQQLRDRIWLHSQEPPPLRASGGLTARLESLIDAS